MYKLNWIIAFALFALTSASALAALGPRVAPIDLMKHDPNDKAQLKEVGDRTYEWSLPNGLDQTIHLDLAKLGINVSDYDEFRFEIKPEGSQVGLHTVLNGFPTPKEVSSWYLKFKAPAGQWTEGRYDLRRDDDGVVGGNYGPAGAAGMLQLSLNRRIIGFAGEPMWRKAQIRNPRFVRRIVSADFDVLDTEAQVDAGEVAYVYPLKVENRTDAPVKAKLDADSAHTLKYFQVSAPTEIALAAHEKRTIPIRVFISRTKAMSLPALYGEPIFPKVYVYNEMPTSRTVGDQYIHVTNAVQVADSDVIPLMGYRRWPMWGVVPVFDRLWWTPATMQAHLDARKAVIPGIDDWKANIVRQADAAMPVDWPVPPLDLLPPGYILSYVCPDCQCMPNPAGPTEFYKHVCPKCKRVFEGNTFMNQTYIPRYLGERFGDIRTLSLAWLVTGKEDYARKAMQMLLKYADNYPKFPAKGERSTCGGTKLGWSSLHGAYLLPSLAEAYAFVHEAPCLDEQSRAKIEHFLNDEACRLARHSVEYSNQTAEHIRAFASAGISTGLWPLAAEGIYGEFGWHEMVECAYSEDGITHEAGAYHNSIFIAMTRFAEFCSNFGVNLLTPRFKRVYDGSLVLGLRGPAYEYAYRIYRDPTYIPALGVRSANEQSLLYGVVGIPQADKMPVASLHMPGAGYVFLRKGNAAENKEIRLNYLKTFDRMEHDKFTTFLYRNGGQVDTHVNRIRYGTPGGNMEATCAHNAIVVDGKDERNVDGQLVAYNPSADAPVAVIRTDPQAPLYEGVTQVRGIALVGDCYIVFDRVSADKPRTIDRFQYGQGKSTFGFPAEKIDAQSQQMHESGVFKVTEGGTCAKELRVDFENGLKMRLVSDKDLAAYKGITGGTWEAQPMEFTFARAQNVRDVTFLAGFSLGKDAEPPALRIRESRPEALILEVQTAGNTYVINADVQKKTVEVK